MIWLLFLLQVHFEEIPNRWYENPWALLPPPTYEINEPGDSVNPYRQNKFKGDFPIIGDDIFLTATVTEIMSLEGRRVPTPTVNTGGKSVFFGDPDQFEFRNNFIFTFDLFKGQQAFKPVDWRLKASYVYNVTNIQVEENSVIEANPQRGRSRTTNDVAIQELFIEKHIFDISENYDFLSSEIGIFPFRSDFRGFIFDDSNSGIRIFGNYSENKWQYNLVFFAMREKDTFSELNTFDDRDQQVFIANLYRQDWPILGYTTQISYHFNRDEATSHFNRSDFLVRPAPIGQAKEHEIRAHYVGWTGEGHLGRLNITHALYHVFGRDDDNPIAARETGIRGFLASAEVSVDVDWWRLRGYGLFQSGDRDPRDDDAEGFDGIIDSPNFAGGEFSFWNRQAITLLGTNLTNRFSPLANLKTSKFEGQSEFVNPGLLLLGSAIDIEATPESRFVIGANWIRFHDSDSLETFLNINDIDEKIGFEVFSGVIWRPFLNNHVIFKVGQNVFWPGEGFQRIYDSSRTLYSVFVDIILSW